MPDHGARIEVEIWHTPEGWRFRAGDVEDGNFIDRDAAEFASWNAVRRQVRKKAKT